MEGQLLGFDASSQAVTVIKRHPKARIRFHFKPENYILMAETVQTQTGYGFQNELDDDVLCQHIVPARQPIAVLAWKSRLNISPVENRCFCNRFDPNIRFERVEPSSATLKNRFLLS
jgi:hypothetical protein